MCAYQIVSIGAGTGQSAIMKGLITLENVSVTALVTTTDNGGSSAMIRDSLQIPSPGDVRNVINAINNKNDVFSQLLNWRFSEGELTGTHLGNLIVGALSRICGSYEKGIQELNTLLGLPAKVLPISNIPAQICAEFEDGSVIEGEWQIIKREKNNLKIINYYLNTPCPADAVCLDAINTADAIIICPGAPGTGIISTLLFEGVKEALMKNNKAHIIAIANVVTYPSQTDGYTLSEHIHELEVYIGKKIHTIIVNTTLPPHYIIDQYKKAGSELLPLDIDNLQGYTIQLGDYLIDYTQTQGINELTRVAGPGQHVGMHRIRHDGLKVAEIIKTLLGL